MTQPTPSELILFTADDGSARVQVRLVDGTVWLSQREMAALFDKDVSTVNEHLQGIFEDAELDPEATIRKFRIVRTKQNPSASSRFEDRLRCRISARNAASRPAHSTGQYTRASGTNVRVVTSNFS